MSNTFRCIVRASFPVPPPPPLLSVICSCWRSGVWNILCARNGRRPPPHTHTHAHTKRRKKTNNNNSRINTPNKNKTNVVFSTRKMGTLGNPAKKTGENASSRLLLPMHGEAHKRTIEFRVRTRDSVRLSACVQRIALGGTEQPSGSFHTLIPWATPPHTEPLGNAGHGRKFTEKNIP